MCWRSWGESLLARTEHAWLLNFLVFLRLDEQSRRRRAHRRSEQEQGDAQSQDPPPASGEGSGSEPPERQSASIAIARIIPNAVTTLALCSGLVSIHYSMAEQWNRAILAIIASAVFDVLDGGAARLLRTQSRFGAVLDSLSDFVSFGVAPAIILHQWLLRPPTTKLVDSFGLMAVMCFAVCAALRLSRFTANALLVDPAAPVRKPKQSSGFVGMPTPAAAGCVLIPAMLATSESVKAYMPAWPEYAIAAYTIFIALLMVSRVPTFSLKGLRIPRRMLAIVLIALVLLFAQFVSQPFLTVAALAAVYLLTVVWSMIASMLGLRNRKPAQPQD